MGRVPEPQRLIRSIKHLGPFQRRVLVDGKMRIVQIHASRKKKDALSPEIRAQLFTGEKDIYRVREPLYQLKVGGVFDAGPI